MKNRKCIAAVLMVSALAAALAAAGCSKTPGREIKVLFIGNSHTYMCDVPGLTASLAGQDGYTLDAQQCAFSDYYLKDHLEDEETAAKLGSGEYDFVIFQEHTHPFPDEEEYADSVQKLMALVPGRKTGFVLYETWARKEEPEAQEMMCRVNEAVAKSSKAALAEVGKRWWEKLEEDPDAGLFSKDGEHASQKGAQFAAQILWETIRGEWENGR